MLGHFDTRRLADIRANILRTVAAKRTELVIIDLTGLQAIDTWVAANILETSQAIRLLGSQVALTGISPAIAQTITYLGVSFSNITIAQTPQHALEQYSSYIANN